MNDSNGSRAEFDRAFNTWFASMEAGLCFEPEHADAKDIASAAADWAKDFLENNISSGYAFPEFQKFPVGVVFWVGGECFYKFSQTEAVRFEDKFTFDPSDGKIKQQHNDKDAHGR